MSSSQRNHHRLVEEFFQMRREQDPELVEAVEARYPTLSVDQWKNTQDTETTVGLLGMSPSRVSQGTAAEYGVEAERRSENE